MVSRLIDKKIYIAYTAEKLLKLKESKLVQVWWEAGAVFVLLGMALILRLHNLTRLSFWFDDAFHIYIAHELRFFETLTYFTPTNVHPPLIYPVLHLWVKYIGVSEFAIRMLSVIMGMTTLVVVYFMARHWLNRKLAMTSLLLLVVSPLHLYWSQSVRPYAWFTLLVTISMLLTLLASERPYQNWVWVAYGLSLVVMIYLHYLTLHVIFCQAIFLLIVLYKNGGGLLRLGITLASVAIAFLPWFDNFLIHSRSGTVNYLAGNIGPEQMVKAVEGFSSWFSPAELVYLVGAVFLPLYIFGLGWLWQNQRKLAILLANWSLLPLLTSWLSSQLRPNFMPRYFIFCVPAFLIIVAAGICASSKVSMRIAPIMPYLLLGLAVGLNLIACNNYNDHYRSQNWRGMVNYIVKNHQKDDLILFTNPYGYAVAPFDYYYAYNLGSPGQMERRSVPHDYFPRLPQPDSRKTVREMVVDLVKNRRRVWVVSIFNDSGKWGYENVTKNIPSSFKSVYYKEYLSTEQGKIAFALYVKQ